MSEALEQRLAEATRERLARCGPLLHGQGRALPRLRVRCDLRGQAAGQFRVRDDGLLEIRYNLAMAQLQPEAFVDRTVPHEVAHAVTWLLHGRRARPHGPEWQAVMRHLGVAEPDRCHHYRLPEQGVRRQRRWPCRCACGPCEVSTTRYNRMRRGTRYLCRRCGQPLEPV